MSEYPRADHDRDAFVASREALRRALVENGQRCTEQRDAVHDVLWHTRTHPTAEEVYRAVRERVPAVSLATVYNALDAFESAGACLKLVQGSGPARYDIRTDEHHHVRCVDCGLFVDVEGPPLREWLEQLEPSGGFELLGGRLVLEGRCDGCRRAAATPPGSASE